MKVKKKRMKTRGIRISIKDDNKNEIAKCFIYLICNNFHNKSHILLEDVFVNGRFRGKKIVNELVKKIKEIIKTLNYYKILATSKFKIENVHKFHEILILKIGLCIQN